MESRLFKCKYKQVITYPLRLNDASLVRIAKYAELSELILTANQIKTLEGLKPLFALKKLSEIDLSENPVALHADYRKTLFEK